MSTRKGLRLEQRIVNLLLEQQKLGVKHNVITKNKFKNHEFKNQFDVVYGLTQANYVECKNYGKGRLVHFEQTASFACKLMLENARFEQGTIITTADYDQRSYALARKLGITLINGEQLKRLEQEPKKILGKLFSGYHQVMRTLRA